MKKLIYIFILAIGSATGYAQIITTIVGNGLTSSPPTGDGGPATAATASPGRITIDTRGNIYISDTYERKIDRRGMITRFAGGGLTPGDGISATSSSLSSPSGQAIDIHGNVYILDQSTKKVRMVDESGIIHSYAGGGTSYPYDGGPATAADLHWGLTDLTLDAVGNMYITGTTIKKIDAAGTITTIGGVGGTSWYAGDHIPATAASFDAVCIATDLAGNIYFTDKASNMIRKINSAGIISTLAGDGSSVGSFTGDGGPATAARLSGPFGIALDTANNIYFSDFYNERIRRIDAVTGIITTVVGNGTRAYSGDGGPASAAELNWSEGITFDCGNNMYICDGSARVRKVTYTAYMDFVSESNKLTVCANSGAANVDTMLSASDTATGQPMDWMVYTGAMHGTVSGSYSTLSNGGTKKPSGFTYTPAPGYSGADSFTILVGPCAQVGDLRTIYVTVDEPAVAAISGIATDHVVCLGKTVALTDATAGGTWSVSGTAVTLSGTTVKGVVAGTATVSYSLTDGYGCSNAATSALTVKDCPVSVPTVAAEAGVTIYPNPATSTITIDGVQGEQQYRIMTIVGTQVLSGSLHSGANSISLGRMASGVYMLEVEDPATGDRMVRRIVKE